MQIGVFVCRHKIFILLSFRTIIGELCITDVIFDYVKM